jgi:hypothetical protein
MGKHIASKYILYRAIVALHLQLTIWAKPDKSRLETAVS